jgi:hypothetical protein
MKAYRRVAAGPPRPGQASGIGSKPGHRFAFKRALDVLRRCLGEASVSCILHGVPISNLSLSFLEGHDGSAASASAGTHITYPTPKALRLGKGKDGGEGRTIY